MKARVALACVYGMFMACILGSFLIPVHSDHWSACVCGDHGEIEPPTDGCITYCTGDVDPADPITDEEDEDAYSYSDTDRVN